MVRAGCRHSGRRDRRMGQEGGVLIIMFFLIIAGVCMAAVVVDLLIAERVSRMLQRTADAAALAGVVQLAAEYNPPSAPPAVQCRWIAAVNQQDSWKKAKKAIIRFLRDNPVYGDMGEYSVRSGGFPPDDVSQPRLIKPTIYDEGKYGYEEYDFDNLYVIIRRGMYEKVDTTGKPACLVAGTTGLMPVFASLEQSSWAASGTGGINFCQAGTGFPSCRNDPPVDDVANSVQVTLRLKSLPTFFAKIPSPIGLGIAQFQNLQETALASAEGS